MQSMPILLLRQSLRTSGVLRGRTHHFSSPASVIIQRQQRRFSICRQCKFRSCHVLYEREEQSPVNHQQLHTSSDGNMENGDKTGRRLPSYVENRRSQFSKRFSSLMDTIQSNIFVAGQHLNDLTGYSSIEALKRQIHVQGMFNNRMRFFFFFFFFFFEIISLTML